MKQMIKIQFKIALGGSRKFKRPHECLANSRKSSALPQTASEGILWSDREIGDFTLMNGLLSRKGGTEQS